MLDLSEEIREYVQTVCPPVTLPEVRAIAGASDSEDPTPMRSRRMLVLVAACLLVTVLVAAVLIQIAPGGAPSTSAAATLAHAARVAASQPAGSVPGPNQYLYYEVTGAVLSDGPTAIGGKEFPVVSVQRTQTWVAPDGSGRQRIATTKASLLLPSQQKAWQAAGSPGADAGFRNSDTTLPDSSAGRFGPPGGPFVLGPCNTWRLSYPDTAHFPNQPAALERAIKKYYGVTGGFATVFALAGDGLQVGASPALRAALFKLVEGLPGVSAMGQTRDESGRPGIGVSMTSGGIRTVLIFDPQTSAVLGETFIQSKATNIGGGTVIPKGTVVGFKTFGTTGVTDSMSQIPTESTIGH
jgi:hypothetical protein